MIYFFNVEKKRKIIEADRNVYTNPVLHPSRVMKNHDFFYIAEGEWSIGLETEKQTIKAKKDSVVVLPAELLHYGVGKCSKGTKTLFFHASLENGDGYADKLEKVNENRIFVNCCIDVSNRSNVKKYFEQIILAKMENDENKCFAWFLLLMCELSVENEITDNKAIITGEIKTIIDDNLEKNITNAEIAEALGMSVRNMEIIFKKQFGITVRQYIISQKIKRVKFYLENYQQMKIKEIAELLAFYDEYHLSKQFKREIGVSPLQYRKNFSEQEHISCK